MTKELDWPKISWEEGVKRSLKEWLKYGGEVERYRDGNLYTYEYTIVGGVGGRDYLVSDHLTKVAIGMVNNRAVFRKATGTSRIVTSNYDRRVEGTHWELPTEGLIQYFSTVKHCEYPRSQSDEYSVKITYMDDNYIPVQRRGVTYAHNFGVLDYMSSYLGWGIDGDSVDTPLFVPRAQKDSSLLPMYPVVCGLAEPGKVKVYTLGKDRPLDAVVFPDKIDFKHWEELIKDEENQLANDPDLPMFNWMKELGGELYFYPENLQD